MNYKGNTRDKLLNTAADAAADADVASRNAAAAVCAADASDAAYFSTADTTFSRIDYWVNKYFEITGEDKALYEAEIERINGANNE